MREHLLASLERLRTSYAEGLIRGWGLSQVPLATIEKAHNVFPLSAVQNIYSMVERGIEAELPLPKIEVTQEKSYDPKL